MSLEYEIKNKALELGYESCGIIPIEDMYEYKDKLTERIEKFPKIKKYSEEFYSFANLKDEYPWAKSIIICVRRYGKYKLPKHLEGIIAKFYLVDSRTDENSKDYKDSVMFEEYLNKLGLKTETDRKFGVTALRWAAMKAGLGIVRKNNFFYTDKSGSWVYLEAWIIDKDITLKNDNSDIKPCPSKCNLCMKHCPTKSLEEPYMMYRNTCVSCLTTWDGWDLTNEEHGTEMGKWVYGCDVCQDVCPFNKNKWTDEEEFPGLEDLSSKISIEKIIQMDYDFLENTINPKFWYISKEDVFKWKLNSLNAMLNDYKKDYDKYIDMACNDENKDVQKMAYWVKEKIKN